jgi:hypothetical protein
MPPISMPGLPIARPPTAASGQGGPDPHPSQIPDRCADLFTSMSDTGSSAPLSQTWISSSSAPAPADPPRPQDPSASPPKAHGSDLHGLERGMESLLQTSRALTTGLPIQTAPRLWPLIGLSASSFVRLLGYATARSLSSSRTDAVLPPSRAHPYLRLLSLLARTVRRGHPPSRLGTALRQTIPPGVDLTTPAAVLYPEPVSVPSLSEWKPIPGVDTGSDPDAGSDPNAGTDPDAGPRGPARPGREDHRPSPGRRDRSRRDGPPTSGPTDLPCLLDILMAPPGLTTADLLYASTVIFSSPDPTGTATSPPPAVIDLRRAGRRLFRRVPTATSGALDWFPRPYRPPEDLRSVFHLRSTLAGLSTISPSSLSSLVRRGLPPLLLLALARCLQLTRRGPAYDQIPRLIGISPTTFQRRIRSFPGRLSPRETDRLLRLLILFGASDRKTSSPPHQWWHDPRALPPLPALFGVPPPAVQDGPDRQEEPNPQGSSPHGNSSHGNPPQENGSQQDSSRPNGASRSSEDRQQDAAPPAPDSPSPIGHICSSGVGCSSGLLLAARRSLYQHRLCLW